MLEESTLDGLTTTQRRALEASLPKGRLIAPEETVALVWWAPSCPEYCVQDVDASSGERDLHLAGLLKCRRKPRGGRESIAGGETLHVFAHELRDPRLARDRDLLAPGGVHGRSGKVVRTGVAVTEVAVPGHDHFDLPFGLGDPRNPLDAAVERMTRR
ncbi:hypothetical protein AB0C38_23980 [Amycolatopsis sp. NPDC048633]|uniref:hypothetical protein n=1 Tax=Amycolatopsis sp. NPDC048633 TaxID=3157095 RepID=UPI0033D71BCD